MITLLPPAPSRQDPDNFAEEGDLFLGALPNFAVELNVLGASVQSSEISATNSAASASASELGAIAASNVTVWVSGTTYAIGTVRWSPITFLSYRRKTAGAGTTDPSLDSTNWMLLLPAINSYTYADRTSLRSLTPSDGSTVIVDGLGLFIWKLGSTAVDDGETAFATTSGVWELIGVSPDYVYSAIYVDAFATATLEGRTTTLEGRTTTLEGRFLKESFTMSLTSLASITSSNFTVTVPGATIDDIVIVNPGNIFGATAADQGKLSYVAYISALNTVTVSIRNASASTANITASTWNVLVIKQ